MKTITLLSPLLLVGCMSTPKNVFVRPEVYECDLIISTTWDENHPIAHFERKLEVGVPYYDYLGTEFTLVPTEDSAVYALRVVVEKP